LIANGLETKNIHNTTFFDNASHRLWRFCRNGT